MMDDKKANRDESSLERQLEKNYCFDNIIGKSLAMQKVFDLISCVAESDANIVILGESGTGKELVARSIHAHSNRNDRAFVPVNCGAFPDSLFESELFGYEKGAFTGAYRGKPGLLEYADSGTFFLDEICELSLALQVKLLRVLQDKMVRKVGGTKFKEVDVRIISAANRNLEDAVEQGTLRKDLHYRLNVISIRLPPLRDRKEDIALLCNHFINSYSRFTPKNISGISMDALSYLKKYDWPGNVRELENIIERAITLTSDERIGPKDLPAKMLDSKDGLMQTEFDIPLKQARQKVLDKFEGNYLN